MLNPLFGLKVESLQWLHHLAVKYSGKRGFELELFLREEYEERFGIIPTHVLDDVTRPFAALTEQPKDGLRALWPDANRIRQYRLYKVGEHWKFSLEEFLNQPRWIVEMILDDLRREHVEKGTASATADALEEVKKGLKK